MSRMVPDEHDGGDGLAARYLDLLKAALLDEHYLEHELRIDYLIDCVELGRTPRPDAIRDPAHFLRADLDSRLARRRAGALAGDAADHVFPYTAMGRVRLDHLHRCLDRVRSEAVPGDFVECEPGRGGAAIFARGYLDTYGEADRTVWAASSFRASAAEGDPALRSPHADLNMVRDAFHRFQLLDDRVRFLQGELVDTLVHASIDAIAVLWIGPAAAGEAGSILEAVYDRVSTGGFVVVEHYTSATSAGAIDDFRLRNGVDEALERVDTGALFWRKRHERVVGGGVPADRTGPQHPPLAPAAPGDRCALSVVVVFYDMRRAAERTLHSLSRAYQLDVAELDYEVVVVENGSREPERLGAEFVRSFGPEFRHIDMGADAEPSPVAALNRGIERSRGDVVALMIDGAHVVTPRLLYYGMRGSTTYAPAIVVAQPWYVGPGQQPDMVQQGYDERYEDELFAAIEWPSDGYRLFEIGHFVHDRDWFDGLSESNCVFVPRPTLEQVGGFDRRFSMPGGGAANLELYERLTQSPDLRLVTMLGEASFHQVHGGMTTNAADIEERRERIFSYVDHYRDLRGRVFHFAGRPMHYVGAMPPAALQTRARRQASTRFREAARSEPGMPVSPVPIPEGARLDFVDAFWQSLVWQSTSWLGVPVPNAPTDLVAYQEMLVRARPDWVIEFPTGTGGRALFLASICELLGHGEVVSIDANDDMARPEHPRIRYLEGAPAAPDTLDRVRELVGERPNALVVLGMRGKVERTMRLLREYESFVAVGSYLVVEGTILNGHPVAPEFGPGPWEAIARLLRQRRDFVPDASLERYALTFNPGGFLKRIR